MEQLVEPWLLQAARRRVHEFTAQLCDAGEGEVSVPNLAWTVADLAQHVACLPSFWKSQHEAGDRFERPTNFAAYSDGARAHITETEPALLAEQIAAEYDAFLTALAECDSWRWLYGVETTSSNMCGLVLNELILHGRDLAKVTGAKPPIFERREANAAVDAIMVTTPRFVDPTKAAARPDGVYHIHFRDGHDYTWTKRGGELAIEQGRPNRAAARLNADPATFLLASLGRISRVRAGLSGKMVSYGLRPWRFVGLGTIAIDGV